jgi:hypothetical protein
MLKKILIAFATVVGLVLAIGLVLPSKYRVERSTVLQAPPEAIYRHVANLQRWQEWAPWNAKRYPGSQWTFGGPAEGVGAVRSWRGEDVGQGTLSLTQADPNTGVAYELSMAQGRYLAQGRISFAPEGSGTRVTWVDEGGIGGNPLAHYLVPLIRSRLGADMEEGLTRLAKVAREHSLPGAPMPEPAPKLEPAPVEQATAETPPAASESPAPAPQAAPATEGTGTQVAAPSPAAEGSPGSAPAETPPVTAATTSPSGAPAPAPQGTAAPPGEQPAPAQTPTTGETAPAATNATTTPSPP